MRAYTRETKHRKQVTEKFTQSLLKLHLRNNPERPLHSTKLMPSFGGVRTGAGSGSPSCSRDPLPVRPNPEKDPECLTKKLAEKCFAPSIFAVLRTAKMTSARRLRPTHRSDSPASPSGTRAFRCRAPASPGHHPRTRPRGHNCLALWNAIMPIMARDRVLAHPPPLIYLLPLQHYPYAVRPPAAAGTPRGSRTFRARTACGRASPVRMRRVCHVPGWALMYSRMSSLMNLPLFVTFFSIHLRLSTSTRKVIITCVRSPLGAYALRMRPCLSLLLFMLF